MSRNLLRLYIAIATAAAIYLWLTGPFEGPMNHRLLFYVILLGAVALTAEYAIDNRRAATLASLAGALGITAIAVVMYLSGQ